MGDGIIIAPAVLFSALDNGVSGPIIKPDSYLIRTQAARR